MYNRLDQRLYTVAAEANWKASTDVTDEHTGERPGRVLRNPASGR